MWLRLDPRFAPEALADRAFEARAERARASGEPEPQKARRALMAARLREEVRPELVTIATFAFLSVVAAAAALGDPRRRAGLFVVIAADLARVGYAILPAQESHYLFPQSPAVKAVREAASGAKGGGPSRVARIASAGEPAEEDHLLFETTLPPYFDIYDTAAYVVFPNVNQTSVAQAFFPSAVLFNTYLGAFPEAALDSPVMDLLGAGVVVCRSKLSRPDLAPVSQRAGFAAYRRVNALGRAWIVPSARKIEGDAAMRSALLSPEFLIQKEVLLEGDGIPIAGPGGGGGSIEARDASSREVEFRVRGTGGGFLVEAAPYCSGWRAEIDGFPAPLFRANRYGRAVRVPPGDHVVRFIYMPASFVAGSAVSAAAMAAIIILTMRLRRRERAA